MRRISSMSPTTSLRSLVEKLDAVTTVMFGRPIPALKTLLAEGCLARRQRRGPTYVPSPEDEAGDDTATLPAG